MTVNDSVIEACNEIAVTAEALRKLCEASDQLGMKELSNQLWSHSCTLKNAAHNIRDAHKRAISSAATNADQATANIVNTALAVAQMDRHSNDR